MRAYQLRKEILAHYGLGLEAQRLDSPFSRWEKTRTLDLMDRVLPAPPSVILDIGGGAGAYAFLLAEKGYIVDLIDPIPLHIEQARMSAEGNPHSPRRMDLGDARAIPAEDGCADAVLLFGPLYHLTEVEERVLAIREARRVLRPGGILLTVAISRFASALDGIRRGLIRDSQFLRIVQQDLKDGQHRNESGNPDYFTTAFFHHPDEFKAELIQGGFPSPALCAVEGPVWTVSEPEDADEHERLVVAMRALENEPTLIGASAHMMAVARKPD